MIKYTSKDIIDRAEQLADLQNSDFISASEKAALLNESWNTLYQKIVNAEDRSFIKSVSVADGYRLPSDFYQLASLYVTKDKTQINRVNASQIQGYDITNNTLHLSHEYDGVKVTLEYYPTPKTLFYNSGEKKSRDFGQTPTVIIDENLYIAEDNYIYTYHEGTQLSEIPDRTGLKLKNGILCIESQYVKLFSYAGESIHSQLGPFVIKGNEVTYDEIKTDEDLSAYMAVIMDDDEEILYFVDRSFKLYDRNFNEILDDADSFDLSILNMYCRGDGLYLGETGTPFVKRVLGDVVETFPLGLYTFCCFNDETTLVEAFNGVYYKADYGFNTLLDYPNNIYYTILAYMLAISFKIKQNGDTTLLQGKLEEATNQFYDSLNRDANQYYIMKNVYRNGRGRIW